MSDAQEMQPPTQRGYVVLESVGLDYAWPGPTVTQLLAYMEAHSIPHTARVTYHECGSHKAALEWDDVG